MPNEELQIRHHHAIARAGCTAADIIKECKKAFPDKPLSETQVYEIVRRTCE